VASMVAVRPSRRQPGVWLAGACCATVITGVTLVPAGSPIRWEMAEEYALLDHAERCGRCDFGELRGGILAERAN
jgi:hypothetical protein